MRKTNYEVFKIIQGRDWWSGLRSRWWEPFRSRMVDRGISAKGTCWSHAVQFDSPSYTWVSSTCYGANSKWDVTDFEDIVRKKYKKKNLISNWLYGMHAEMILFWISSLKLILTISFYSFLTWMAAHLKLNLCSHVGKFWMCSGVTF